MESLEAPVQPTQVETHVIRQAKSYKVPFAFVIFLLVISLGASSYLFLQNKSLKSQMEMNESIESKSAQTIDTLSQDILDHQEVYDDLEGRVNAYLRSQSYDCADEAGICLTKLLESEIEEPAPLATESASVPQE